MTRNPHHTAMQRLRCDRVSNARHRCELCKVELIAHAKWCGVCAGRHRRFSMKIPPTDRESVGGTAAIYSQSVTDLGNHSTTRVGVSASGDI
jgi:hypothetical protein